MFAIGELEARVSKTIIYTNVSDESENYTYRSK